MASRDLEVVDMVCSRLDGRGPVDVAGAGGRRGEKEEEGVGEAMKGKINIRG